MKPEEKKEKPTPVRCVCGKEAVTVQLRGKKMISCQNPEMCVANLRTRWHGRTESAIAEWNAIVDSFRCTRR